MSQIVGGGTGVAGLVPLVVVRVHERQVGKDSRTPGRSSAVTSAARYRHRGVRRHPIARRAAAASVNPNTRFTRVRTAPRRTSSIGSLARDSGSGGDRRKTAMAADVFVSDPIWFSRKMSNGGTLPEALPNDTSVVRTRRQASEVPNVPRPPHRPPGRQTRRP